MSASDNKKTSFLTLHFPAMFNITVMRKPTWVDVDGLSQNAMQEDPVVDKWTVGEFLALLSLYAAQEMRRDFEVSKRDLTFFN